MRIVAFANQKGGCGKTTSAVNVAAALAVRGKRVLVIDMDPQAHATIGLLPKEKPSGKSIHKLLVESDLTHEKIKQETLQVKEDLYLIPSDVTLCALDMELAEAKDRDRRLAHIVEELDGDYHFIIIDSPPNLGLLTFNVLLAVEELVVPIDMSFLSLHGLGKLLETVNLIEEKCDHPIRISALANHVDKRTSLSKKIIHHIEERFMQHMLTTVIHDRTCVREAMGNGVPVVQYAPRSSSALEYLALADEILEYENKIDANQFILKTGINEEKGESFEFIYYGSKSEKVKLAGDFNLWNPEEHPLTYQKDKGLWSCTIKLEPGAYEYKFLVDGVWAHDPNNPNKKENELGAYTSILEIEEKEPQVIET